jgi:hypothetical protein
MGGYFGISPPISHNRDSKAWNVVVLEDMRNFLVESVGKRIVISVLTLVKWVSQRYLLMRLLT